MQQIFAAVQRYSRRVCLNEFLGCQGRSSCCSCCIGLGKHQNCITMLHQQQCWCSGAVDVRSVFGLFTNQDALKVPQHAMEPFSDSSIGSSCRLHAVIFLYLQLGLSASSIATVCLPGMFFSCACTSVAVEHAARIDVDEAPGTSWGRGAIHKTLC